MVDTYRPGFDQGFEPAARGFVGQSTTTPRQSRTRTSAIAPPGHAVPIIFVPGIMGSNLKTTKPILNKKKIEVIAADKPVWRVDSTLSFAFEWGPRQAPDYQLRLRHDMVEVDPNGDIDGKGWWVFEKDYTPLAELPIDEARRRGWGQVSAAFYGETLDWMESIFNRSHVVPGTRDDNPNLANLKTTWAQAPQGPSGHPAPVDLDEATIKQLLKVRNPVYAVGYNWLGSNEDAADLLADRILEIIAENNHDCSSCEQVILVTHSMGGLVARHTATQAGMADLIAGVFHAVMPTDGAAAAYKRMVSGAGGEGGGPIGWFTAQAVGPTADYIMASMPLNPGPMQLLPNARYNNGQPWLFIQHGQGDDATISAALPKADPYEEIYLDEQHWWRSLNVGWMNPAGLDSSNLVMDYKTCVDDAKFFHQDLGFHANTHAYYAHARPAYAQVTWTLDDPASQTWPNLQRADLSDADRDITLSQAEPPAQTDAHMSGFDAPGDGMVPGDASAAAVARGVKAQNLLVIDTNPAIEHGSVYALKHGSEPLRAMLHAITHSVVEHLKT